MMFTILGEPFGKQRPRFSRQGAYVKTYTPAKTSSYEEHVRQSFINQCDIKEPIDGEIKVKIAAFYSIPKSVSKKKQNAMMSGLLRPTKKPDTDNIAKAVLDSLNNIAFYDDKQVVSLKVEKWYSNTPRVDVEINHG